MRASLGFLVQLSANIDQAGALARTDALLLSRGLLVGLIRSLLVGFDDVRSGPGCLVCGKFLLGQRQCRLG